MNTFTGVMSEVLTKRRATDDVATLFTRARDAKLAFAGADQARGDEADAPAARDPYKSENTQSLATRAGKATGLAWVDCMHQARFGIHSDVRLHAKVPLPAFGYTGSISPVSLVQGITASISGRNTSRRVCLRLPANSASEKLSWFMEKGSQCRGTRLNTTLHQLLNNGDLFRVS